MIKALPVRHRHNGSRAAPLGAHIAYLVREGVTRDGAEARLFDAHADTADAADFAARCQQDRHHFRFIISPEDAGEMEDLRAFTRDLMVQMQVDLETPLDWVAVDHWNTAHPHVHLLVRGVDAAGQDLVLSRDYIAHGLRSRAQDLVMAELGPRSEHAIEKALARDIAADRWTGLDAEIVRAAGERGEIDMRPGKTGPGDPRIRRLMIARLNYLEKGGLAQETAPGRWHLAEGAQGTLRDMGRRRDIIHTIARALADAGEERGLERYAIVHGAPRRPVVGRLLASGLHDELSGSVYAVIDGVDGQTHHVILPGAEAIDRPSDASGIVELHSAREGAGSRTGLRLVTRSDWDLARQVAAPGATWLDHRLIERGKGIADQGFGQDVRRAMDARCDHLVDLGLARRIGERVVFAKGLLERLRGDELEAVAREIATHSGHSWRDTRAGQSVAGTYRRRLALSSGRFAVIEGGLGFTLVPWSRDLDGLAGQRVTGLARPGGGIEWSLGRQRGLSR
ncbi:DUF3363 domain-containing protein [Novosphingobium sp. 9]|uniref:DUF3363 domain-containing protein n=1 Tax=Novosphingobium sp. 9 TaxID=2025349 RepID=UPI0028CB456C|nr:DUF3363 domain-containing protein [Novosphingobium sp. 9]